MPELSTPELLLWLHHPEVWLWCEVIPELDTHPTEFGTRSSTIQGLWDLPRVGWATQFPSSSCPLCSLDYNLLGPLPRDASIDEKRFWSFFLPILFNNILQFQEEETLGQPFSACGSKPFDKPLSPKLFTFGLIIAAKLQLRSSNEVVLCWGSPQHEEPYQKVTA